MRLDLPLTGGGGEPVDLRRTIRSHGVVRLAPQRILDDGAGIELPLRLRDGRTTLVRITQAAPGFAAVHASGALRGNAARAELTGRVARILALDADFSPFYARAARDPALAWVTRGAGRFARSATTFEDVVKTICTTNCAFSATIRMTNALVSELGEPVAGAPAVRLFPTPQAMAAAPEAWYRDVARAGYRGAYLRAIAASVASGELDLDALAAASPDALSDDDLDARLRELPGVGPYAAAHIMMLMGRYSRLVFDSWTRPAYVRLSGRRVRGDATIVRRFAPYGRFAGLAFWCYVTNDWLDDADGADDRAVAARAASIAASTTGSGSSSLA